MRAFLGLHPLNRRERESLAARISAIEKTTAGEVRIALHRKRHRDEKELSLHDLALRHFRRLSMDKTKDQIGVMIFLLLDERKLQILADEGIHKKVAEGAWDEIAAEMSGHFKDGKLHDGLMAGLARVGELLTKHFPFQPGDRNELPNGLDVS